MFFVVWEATPIKANNNNNNNNESTKVLNPPPSGAEVNEHARHKHTQTLVWVPAHFNEG